ncbi:MAG: restriction endonuclease subunit S [Azoarcus sp.]|nr:restriction endonuclease subunit S [Azoarcus sp.]
MITKSKRLGEVVSYIRGITFKPEDVCALGTADSVVCMRTKNIQADLDESDLIAVDQRFAKREEQMLGEGDILISSANSWNLVGKSVYVPKLSYRATAGGFISIVRADTSMLDPRYLYHWITTDKTQALIRRCGRQTTNISNLSSSQFLDLEIPLPTLGEQKRIAAILDKADSLRRKRQQAIRLADDFLRAVFLDMFGDPVTNPKEWPVENLSNLCDVATGATPSRDAPSYFDGPHPWIKTGEVDSDWIVSAEERISDSAIAETNCKLFPPQTILVAMYGQGKTRGKVGMLGIPAATNQACAAILPSSKVNSEFLFSQLRMSYEALREMGRGGNQENLNLGMIKTLDILRPPTELVSKYSAIRKQLKALSKPQQEVETHSLKLAASLQAEFFG